MSIVRRQATFPFGSYSSLLNLGPNALCSHISPNVQVGHSGIVNPSQFLANQFLKSSSFCEALLYLCH